MRIGLSYDLKVLPQEGLQHQTADDAFEEYDSPETVEIIAGALEKKGHRIVHLGGGVQFLDNVRREKGPNPNSVSQLYRATDPTRFLKKPKILSK